MKRKVCIVIGVVLLSLIAIIGTIGYQTYNKVGDYMVGQMLESQLTQSVLGEIGVDLSEPGRILTEVAGEKLC